MNTTEFEQTFTEWLKMQPQETECRKHPGVMQKIAEELTKDQCKRWAMSPDCWRLEYQACPICSKKYWNRELAGYGVPELLVDCCFDNWEPRNDGEKQHLSDAREFAVSVRKGFLLLLGPVGVGKSHLAVSVMRHYVRKSITHKEYEYYPAFIKQSTLLMELRATYDDKKARDPRPRCQYAPLLVLDEMGLSGGGRDEAPMIHDILDYRYTHMLPTVITSNLTWAELSADLGDRLTDRLKHAAYKVLSFSGESQRAARRDEYFSIMQAHKTDPYEHKEPTTKPF